MSPFEGNCSVVSRRINSTGSISRKTISDIVNPCVPAEQYLVNGEFHLGPRILQWSRGEETCLSMSRWVVSQGSHGIAPPWHPPHAALDRLPSAGRPPQTPGTQTAQTPGISSWWRHRGGRGYPGYPHGYPRDNREVTPRQSVKECIRKCSQYSVTIGDAVDSCVLHVVSCTKLCLLARRVCESAAYSCTHIAALCRNGKARPNLTAGLSEIRWGPGRGRISIILFHRFGTGTPRFGTGTRQDMLVCSPFQPKGVGAR